MAEKSTCTGVGKAFYSVNGRVSRGWMLIEGKVIEGGEARRMNAMLSI